MDILDQLDGQLSDLFEDAMRGVEKGEDSTDRFMWVVAWFHKMTISQ